MDRFRRRFRLQADAPPSLEVEWTSTAAVVRLRNHVLREAPSLSALVAAGPLEVDGRRVTLERRGRGAGASVDVVDAGAFLDGGERAPWLWPRWTARLLGAFGGLALLAVAFEAMSGGRSSPVNTAAVLVMGALLVVAAWRVRSGSVAVPAVLFVFLTVSLPLDLLLVDGVKPVGLLARGLVTLLLGRTWWAARALRQLARPLSSANGVGVAGTPVAVPPLPSTVAPPPGRGA